MQRTVKEIIAAIEEGRRVCVFPNSSLSEANLSGANLSEANLSGANLSEADLSEANLSWANLSEANLSGANLSGSIGLAELSQYSIALVVKIAKIVLEDNAALEMETVHVPCGTTHCLAGWICALDSTANAMGRILGWNAAACLAVPSPAFTGLFYASSDEVIEFLQKVIATNGDCLR